MDRGTVFLIGSSETGVPYGCVGVRSLGEEFALSKNWPCFRAFVARAAGGQLLRKAVLLGSQRGASTIEAAVIANHVALRSWYNARGFVHRETKIYPHLPFAVDFLYLDLS